MLKRLAIEGIDGAGKTSVAAKLASQLETDGYRVRVFAPYRLVQAHTGDDTYPMWQEPETAKMAIKALHKTFEECETDARAAGADIIIYDRHWMTALSELPAQSEQVADWSSFIQTALLRVPIKTAIKRCSNDRDEPWMAVAELERYSIRYQALARQYSKFMLGTYRSDDVAPEDIAETIKWDMYIRR